MLFPLRRHALRQMRWVWAPLWEPWQQGSLLIYILTADPRLDLRALHKPVAVIKNGSVVAGALPD
jgi:hypothetical protein